VRQLLVESVLVGVAAGAAALLCAEWTLRVLFRIFMSLAALPWAITLDLEPDIRVFAYTSAIALVSGAVLGLLPALQASSPRIVEGLQGRDLFGGRLRGAVLRRVLVVAQIAASAMLLFSAGLLLRALRSAEALDLGFKTAGVIYADYDLRAAGFSPARAAAFNDALIEAARSTRDVTDVAVASHVPLHGGVRWAPVRLVGTEGTPAEQHAIVSTVSPAYFTALRIPLVSGRGFDPAIPEAAPAAVISEGLARRFWPGQPAVGKAVILPESSVPRTVVGVVRDAADAAIWREKQLAIYLPADATADARDLRLLVRTTGDTKAVSAVLARRASVLAGDLVVRLVPLDELLRLWNLPSRVAAAGAGVLSALALALACIGLYGVLTFAVTERTREIGIRMALGADGRSVVALILGDAWRLIGFGLVIGTACALAAAPLLGRLLFGVSAFDPVAVASVVLVLTAVSLASAYAPARRASRLEPLVVLRTE
jgi:predicted permease